MNLILSIVTPIKETTFEVEWLEIETPVGNRVILPHHAPLIAALKPRSTLLYKLVDGQENSCFVLSGVIEVDRTRARVIINDAATK